VTELALPPGELSRHRRPRVGYAMTIVAATMFAINGAVAKIGLEASDMGTLRWTELRSTGGFIGLALGLALVAPHRLRIGTRRELGWLAFYGSCFEPAIIDRSQKREPAPSAMSPYGEFDTMFKTLTDQLAAGPYLLGMRFLAVDVLWGTALGWITHFGLIPAVPVIQSYVERVNARPAFVKARARDAERTAGQVRSPFHGVPVICLAIADKLVKGRP